MWHPISGDAFDRRHLHAFAADGQGQTTEDSSPIDMNRARAAGALVTSLLRARQVKALAQNVEQALAWVELERVRPAIDAQGCHRS
jgi:hypothetical protein